MPQSENIVLQNFKTKKKINFSAGNLKKKYFEGNFVPNFGHFFPPGPWGKFFPVIIRIVEFNLSKDYNYPLMIKVLKFFGL